MSKTVVLLRLVGLLSHRRTVSFKTMQQVAGVPKRTLYRYLNDLSEANIPIFYDKQTRGYRLAGPVGNASELLNFNELILATVALGVLKQQVNEQYGRLIDDLMAKFTANSSLPLEEILQTVDLSVVGGTTSQDYSEALSRVVISAAILCNRPLVVTRLSGPPESCDIVIPKGTIHYDAEWLLNDREKPLEQALHVNQLSKVIVE